MSGGTELTKILSSLSPKVLPDSYVFCTVPEARYGDYAEVYPIASFQEQEGLTLVLTKARAEALDWTYDCLFNCISLQVHSSLTSVGLTAAVAAKLAASEISVNMIAGYYHDHLFVPQDQAREAMDLLESLKTR